MWLEFYSFFNCTCSGARGSRLIDRTCKSITHCFSKRLHGWFIESVFFLSDEHSTDFWVFFYIHCSASSCSTRLEIALRPVRRERTWSCFVLLCRVCILCAAYTTASPCDLHFKLSNVPVLLQSLTATKHSKNR